MCQCVTNNELTGSEKLLKKSMEWQQLVLIKDTFGCNVTHVINFELTGSEKLLKTDSGVFRADERVPAQLPLKLFPILGVDQFVDRLKGQTLKVKRLKVWILKVKRLKVWTLMVKRLKVLNIKS